MNKVKGNMYEFVTHTHNVIRGVCPHRCTYCYMNKLYKKGWLERKPLYLDEKELKKNLGKGNFIFVGSSCDMWAKNVPIEWIRFALMQCEKFPNNEYLFQSKNPLRIIELSGLLPPKCHIGTTVETNRVYPCMGNSAEPADKAFFIQVGKNGPQHLLEMKRFITIEPVLDFDLKPFVKMLKKTNPDFISIGADSGSNHLPEPPPEKIRELIADLEKFTAVHLKKNLKRLLPVAVA